MWLKKDKYWNKNDREAKKAVKHSIRIMLQQITELWPRDSGQSWYKPKFHEQLHVPDDIQRNGAPVGWDTKCTEHNHITTFIKNPARQT